MGNVCKNNPLTLKPIVIPKLGDGLKGPTSFYVFQWFFSLQAIKHWQKIMALYIYIQCMGLPMPSSLIVNTWVKI
jgi:hypothetical protein